MPRTDDRSAYDESDENLNSIDKNELERRLLPEEMRDVEWHNEANPDKEAEESAVTAAHDAGNSENEAENTKRNKQSDEMNDVRLPHTLGASLGHVCFGHFREGHPLLTEENGRVPECTNAEGNDSGHNN